MDVHAITAFHTTADNLPKFSDGVDADLNWRGTADLIRRMANIPSVLKFSTLKKSLTGKAASLADTIPAYLADAINSLFTLLDNEYLNTSAIKDEQYRILDALREPKSTYNGLNRFLQQLCSITAILAQASTDIAHDDRLYRNFTLFLLALR